MQMINENKFYVYVHSRLNSGEPFYVGKGHADRAYTHKSRNPHWKNIVAKDGDFHVSFIATNLDEDFAFLLECELIDRYKRFGVKLANQTNGGEGVKILSDEIKIIHQQKTKLAMSKIEMREKCRINAKKSYENLEFKNARISELKEYWSNPENRKAQSERVKLFLLNNPDRFKNDCEKRKLAQAKPEVREKMRLAKLGKKQTKEQIEKRANANRGSVRGKYKPRKINDEH